MLILQTDVPILVIELSLLALVIIAVIVVGSIFIYRSLKATFKEVFRQQSKFDIELRKAANLVSKVVKDPNYDKYKDAVIKDLGFEDKKILLELVDAMYAQIDGADPDNKYVVETYDNLQEIRRVLAAKVLEYNKKISLFPFNVFARFLKMQVMSHYAHQ
ncbi:MAG: hypothetical protein V1761_00150 [bacterium]